MTKNENNGEKSDMTKPVTNSITMRDCGLHRKIVMKVVMRGKKQPQT